MFLLDSTVIFSASDLGAAAGCEWAVMRTLDAKLGRVAAVPDAGDAMLRRAGSLGDEHELRYLEKLRGTRQVVEFARPSMRELPQAAAQTADAFRAGADVLFQATFFDGRFVGFADFIMRTESGSYEVFDTKLARSAKITALLQVAAYSDQLDRLGIPTGENVHLLLGDGRTSTHRLRDILPVYRKRRARLERLIDERVADPEPTAWGDPRYAACGRCAACTLEVEAHRDVLLVAGMRLTQRRHLLEAGITTIEQLAASSGPVAGLVEATVNALRAQARLQLVSRQLATGEAGHADAPAFEVYNPVALGALPEPDAGDIFFDFEGDPLYSEAALGDDTVEWGLDYLFGLIEQDGTFRAFWAHDYAEERQALIDFLAYVAKRRAAHPNLHIYHYAAYERTHLLSLAARHGVGEDAVDDLLRANVLVDLYPVVKKSLRVGSHSYSIKKLEPLYMGDDHREGVDNAADSITEYADSRALYRDGDLDGAQAKLDAIADYNEYDCLSTLRLRDWLLARADEAGVPRAASRDLELDIPVREPSPVYLALAAQVADAPPGDRTPDQTAIALASAAIDYHRREGKEFWQEHFDRLRNPADEWSATRDVLIVEHATVDRDWSLVGRTATSPGCCASRAKPRRAALSSSASGRSCSTTRPTRRSHRPASPAPGWPMNAPRSPASSTRPPVRRSSTSPRSSAAALSPTTSCRWRSRRPLRRRRAHRCPLSPSGASRCSTPCRRCCPMRRWTSCAGFRRGAAPVRRCPRSRRARPPWGISPRPSVTACSASTAPI
ncbi:TM0106 family RecB-like putative nuclease [Cryobacterium sp. PAMC25264]|uniref:TM0106 family RecB-like putative nuclease n=1 Tax=Cryobacterium sp. PAMC25264 TaxID=2861288 RepID=UPI0021073D2D|nr:TM0106 family RecB-like putative nuclease [Cryobacterium sp. PAMC25264]